MKTTLTLLAAVGIAIAAVGYNNILKTPGGTSGWPVGIGSLMALVFGLWAIAS